LRIVFNLLNTGLGNNGGSLTLIKSANMLKKMGHDVIVVDGGKNKNTWVPLIAPHLIISGYKDIPQSDVIIATGIKSVDSTNKSNIDKKFFWIRGYEKWVYPEDILIQVTKESSTKKIVNSICLQNKFKQFGIESELIRPGYDFNEFYPLNIRKKNKKIVLGGLYSSGKKRECKRSEWIIKAYKQLLTMDYDVLLYMYGSDGTPREYDVNFYAQNPANNMKNTLYNTCDIWLAPTKYGEGLHLPPAEAGLGECSCVGTDNDLNGLDYLIHNKTGLLSKDNFQDFLFKIIDLIKDKDLRIELGKNLRQEVMSYGSREENMKRMIELFEK